MTTSVGGLLTYDDLYMKRGKPNYKWSICLYKCSGALVRGSVAMFYYEVAYKDEAGAWRRLKQNKSKIRGFVPPFFVNDC
jgi:hypothetical protein